MRIAPWIVIVSAAAGLSLVAVPCLADEPVPPSPVEEAEASVPAEATAAPDPVAVVLGDEITRAELAASGGGPDPGAALMGMVAKPMIEKYLDEHDLRATDAEIELLVSKMRGSEEMFRQQSASRAAALTARLVDPNLSEEDRAIIVRQIKTFERYSRGEMWPDAEDRADIAKGVADLRARAEAGTLTEQEKAMLPGQLDFADRFANVQSDEESKAVWEKWKAERDREMAAPMIEWWKFNRALFKERGGSILFQQAGLEAFSATKAWLEEREQAGDFAILDPALKEGFWSYYTRDHGTFVIAEPEGTEFDAPWWEQEEPAAE